MEPSQTPGFMQEIEKILQAADRSGVILRLMGSTAFRIHCPKHLHVLDSMKRELTDIDFAGKSSQTRGITKLFAELQYEIDKGLMLLDTSRLVFRNPINKFGADIFLDRLRMCHTIDFRNRLELDYPTITLTDLLFEKIQIVKLNEKDIKDTLVLLLEHPLGSSEKETINVDYVCDVLSEDWGFYYTATTNLNKIKDEIPRFGDSITVDQQQELRTKIENLLTRIEAKSKSLKWRMRARVGTARPWYREVEEKESIF